MSRSLLHPSPAVCFAAILGTLAASASGGSRRVLAGKPCSGAEGRGGTGI